MSLPDKRGYFEAFGGRFIPETLMAAVSELQESFEKAWKDEGFRDQFRKILAQYVGRPSLLYSADVLSDTLNGARILLKREDLMHTGAHKINNAIGQVLLARSMGKERIIAETGAGQHGVATATACALLKFPCEVYMGEEDMRRQRMNVFRMELLGARVIPVSSGSRTLKDAINEAIRDWVTNVGNTHYCIGSVVGPHPYPEMVRQFQSVIGTESRQQMLEQHGRLPDAIIACVGGGSNAIGIFYPFIGDEKVRLIGVEAGGRGLETGEHAAPLSEGSVGYLHGAKSYVMQDSDGQIRLTHSVSAGLDYSGVGPEHAWLRDSGRAEYTYATDEEALSAFRLLCSTEGIIPALESSHAVAHAVKLAPSMKKDEIILVNLSGRGDKDLEIVEGLV